MNRKTIIISALTLVLITVLIVVGKRRSSKGLEVEISELHTKTIVSTVSANGKIRPEGEVKISADVSGEITELNVQEGDTVKEGQLLLKIDPDLYVSALDRAKANFYSAKTSYNTNLAMLSQSESRFTEQQAAYKRSTSLFEDEVISQAEYDIATSTYQVARADVKAAQERVEAARFGIANAQAGVNEATKNLQRTQIFAPSDGVISALNAEQGERVVGTAQMAGTEIMIISNFDNMEVTVDVNENDILQINKFDSAIIEVDAYGDRTFKGIVTEIARSASGTAGIQMTADQITNFEVKIRILKSSYQDLSSATDAPFLPGMSASVEIEVDRKADIQCLPIEAVTTRSSEDSTGRKSDELDEVIFIADKGKAKKLVVKTGIQDSRYIEIVADIPEDAKIISGPYDAVSKKLKDGQIIEVVKKEEDESWD